MQPIHFITQLPLFNHLPEADAQALAAEFETRPLAAGETLFRQGEPGETFYIVQSGSLSVSAQRPDGQAVALDPLGPGDCTGEMVLLSGQPYEFTATARQDSTLLRLPKAAFDRLTADHPALITTLAKALLPRIQETQASLALSRLFGEMDESMQRRLVEQLQWRRLDCGEVLCRQGDPGDEMYIVVQGRLRFSVEQGGQSRDLGEVGAGESIGEFSLMTERHSPENRRSATIYATRLTDVIVITRTVFEGLLCQSPEMLLRLARRIVQRELLISKDALPAVSAQVIAVIPAHPGPLSSAFARQMADALQALGGTLYLDPARFDSLYGKPGAAQTPLDAATSLLVDTWLDERERQHEYAVYDTQLALDEAGQLTPWALRCVEDADILLLVGEGGADPTLTAVEAALPAAHTRARLELALLHPADCAIPSGTAAWLAPRQAGEFPPRSHHHLRLGHAADFRRLARRLSGHPVGLALSGGGARGWAHIGVMRALEEAHLEVDWIGGASMGAIIAAAVALDWPSARLSALAAQFSDPKKLLDYTLPYASITATRRITALLQALLGEAQVEDTWRPFYCVSANLTRGEEQLHTRGMLWKAVRASMAFPGVFAPVAEEGCVLIDGGAANNLPVDRLREFCPTGTVIGVNLLTSSPVPGPYEFGPSLSGWQVLRSRLNPFGRKMQAPSLVDIVAGVVYSNNCYRLNETWRCADLLIDVPVEAYGLLEFDKYLQIIELGYQAAKEQLPQLERLPRETTKDSFLPAPGPGADGVRPGQEPG